MEALLEQAKTAAASASGALAQIRGESKYCAGGSTSGGGYFSDASPAAHQGHTNEGYQVWIPKTMEIKGICEYGSRFTSGVPSEYADEYLSRLEGKSQNYDSAIDWSRSRASNRFSFNFKLALVLHSPPPREHAGHGLVGLAEGLEDPDRRGAQGRRHEEQRLHLLRRLAGGPMEETIARSCGQDDWRAHGLGRAEGRGDETRVHEGRGHPGLLLGDEGRRQELDLAERVGPDQLEATRQLQFADK